MWWIALNNHHEDNIPHSGGIIMLYGCFCTHHIQSFKNPVSSWEVPRMLHNIVCAVRWKVTSKCWNNHCSLYLSFSVKLLCCIFVFIKLCSFMATCYLLQSMVPSLRKLTSILKSKRCFCQVFSSCISIFNLGTVLPQQYLSSSSYWKVSPPPPSAQLLTVPQQEGTTLMDATDGPFPWSSMPQLSVFSAGSEARAPHEMNGVTGNKRRAPVLSVRQGSR